MLISNDVITFTPSQENYCEYIFNVVIMIIWVIEITVLDKLDVPTGYVIDYEWTSWTPANADYNPMFVWNKQGDMYAVTHIPNSTLYSVDKVSGDFTPLLQLTDSNTAGRAAQLWRPYDITIDKDGHIYCLEGDPWRNDWGTAHGWTEGRYIYKIDMTDPANPVGDWFTPGSAELATLLPKHAYSYWGLEVDNSGNLYFSRSSRRSRLLSNIWYS